jgi:hypothetical protein
VTWAFLQMPVFRLANRLRAGQVERKSGDFLP